MAWREGRKRAGGGGGSSLDLRLTPADRTGGPVKGRAETDRRRRESSTPREPKKRKGGSKSRRSGFGRLFYWGFVLALWGVIAGIGALVWIGIHLPPIESLEIPKRPPSVLILGSNGATLATRGDMGGAAVPMSELPTYLPNAFVAIEDRRFYSHFGIDPLGIMRAIVRDILRRGASQGGSTLTQQLAKNLFLTQERTISRKAQEVVLALWLEHKYTKAQILELYLNRVYFGAGAYGVEGAAQRYFGKSARRLTLPEAAMLAGLVQSPSRLAPNHNPEGAERRAAVVLADMAEQKMISADAEKAALAHPARAVRPAAGGSANYVADWVMDAVDDLIGKFDQDIVVQTTIDPVLQSAAEQALNDALAQKGDKLNISQGALVAMTPDGVVRALVGGRNYGESQFDRAVDAKRQPGSSFKPFVYLTALEHGLTPDSVRDDAPIQVKGWKPENFERQYAGPVTLTQALANSLNTVSVRLTLEVTSEAVVRTAYRLGITSMLEPNASIALGTSEVAPIEMVSAYSTFANGGLAVTPHVVTRIRGPDGKTLYDHAEQPLGRIVDPRYVGMMNTMMQQVLLSGTARGANLPGWQAAGKTGTSQDFRDAWFIGYTAHLVTGVWLGNDDNSPTKKAVGGGLPVEVWSRFMRFAHQGVAPTPLPGLENGGWFGSNLQAGVQPPAPVGASIATNRYGQPSYQPGYQPGYQQNAQNNQQSDGPFDFLEKLFGRH
ncbi:MAG TPA: transglycosylase domain-containing protein [Xanthobacteraceae bacterium]|jgi:penicillin-binding protein 1A|nr:transglycosylase domain-containing protein [Xanthobacteraceae bacterium]